MNRGHKESLAKGSGQPSNPPGKGPEFSSEGSKSRENQSSKVLADEGLATIVPTKQPVNVALKAMQQIRATLQRVIKDAVMHGITLSATAGMTSPYRLSTPIVPLAQRLHLEIVTLMSYVP
ncbi:hypothetical protein LWI29_008184 [Acer saccharum]|uniref:Uncharacterized protein n=1 Tax=Acer saccharum TaxID=4024 RepID=A0AA39VHZ1_ACESA|nr:hypothetical protein LWI29_008184 [Acer saccharum]